MRRISAALQSRPWCARRDGIAHSVCQEAREGLELKAIAPTLILAGQVQVRNQFGDFRPRHSPAEFAKFLASDTEKLARVIRTVCQSEQLVSMANPALASRVMAGRLAANPS